MPRLTVSNLVPTVIQENLNRNSLLIQQASLIRVIVGFDAPISVTNYGVDLGPCDVDGLGTIIYGTGGHYAFDDDTRRVYLLAIGAPAEVNVVEQSR